MKTEDRLSRMERVLGQACRLVAKASSNAAHWEALAEELDPKPLTFRVLIDLKQGFPEPVCAFADGALLPMLSPSQCIARVKFEAGKTEP